MKKYVYGGIRPDDGDYIFDYRYSIPTDIIEISKPQLYVSSINNHIYWFGYMFKDTVSSRQRTDFIHYIKGLSNKKVSDLELTQFIELPLGELDKRIGMYNIDCFVYPTSGRSELVSKMISVIGNYTSRDMKKVSFELVKDELQRFSEIKGKNILVVDDINTSGATLNEILRILSKVNKDCDIFLYTLIGNFNK